MKKAKQIKSIPKLDTTNLKKVIDDLREYCQRIDRASKPPKLPETA